MSGAAGLSIHVVDIAEGCPAAGLPIDLLRLGSDHGGIVILKDHRLDSDGKLSLTGDDSQAIGRGRYDVVFHVGAYYRAVGRSLPDILFLDLLPVRFGIDDPARHHHLPLKLTPWGVSLFLTR